MRLILVRHAESQENMKGILQGHLGGTLSEKGREQSMKLALKLKEEKLDAIFSSDLQRAKETAVVIARYHDIPVRYIPELRERDVGVFEGSDRGEFENARIKSKSLKNDFKPEGGESYGNLKDRAKRFLDILVKDYKGKTVLVISHKAFNRMLLGILLNAPIEEAAVMEQDNACINIIDTDHPGKACIINSVGHL